MVPSDLLADAYTVTFTSMGSYIRLPGWSGGDLQFYFRTTQPEAVLLYQHGRNASYHDIQLAVAVREGMTILECLTRLRNRQPLAGTVA